MAHQTQHLVCLFIDRKINLNDTDLDKIVWTECKRAARKLDPRLHMTIYDAEDFHSRGYLAARKALRKHKPDRGELTKYLHIRTRLAIIDYIRELLPISRKDLQDIKSKTITMPKLGNIDHAFDLEDNRDKRIEEIDVDDFILHSLREFSARDVLIFRGIAIERRTGSELSDVLHISEQRIYKIYDDTRSYLRVRLMNLQTT